MTSPSQGLFELIDRFEAIPTVSALWITYLDAARQAGYRHGMAFFVEGEATLAKRSFASSMPDGWLNTYSATACEQVDPIAAQLKVSHAPFTWRLKSWEGSPTCRSWYGLSHDFGMHAGFVIMDRSGGPFRAIRLSGDDIQSDPHDRMALHLAGLRFLHRAEMLGVCPPLPDEDLHLSDRERECLQWVAEGKTDWEIGHILSISEKTANAYIERVKRKLGVQSRAQALVAAIRMGLIEAR